MKGFKITFLGTCACDFSPKLNTEFKDKFDNDARRASSILINEKYLVDCGPHALDSMRILNKGIDEIEDIIITHLHDDHFDKDNIAKIALVKDTPLRLWVREDAVLESIPNVEIKRMRLLEKTQIGELCVTGMSANHDKSAYPQHLLIEMEDKKIFYGCDGGWLLNDTYNSLWHAEIDLAVLDCTVGDYEGDYRLAEHNSIPMLRLMIASLKTIGAINEKTKIYLSHIAPSLHAPHEKTVELADAFGASVAYDGLKIEV